MAETTIGDHLMREAGLRVLLELRAEALRAGPALCHLSILYSGTIYYGGELGARISPAVDWEQICSIACADSNSLEHRAIEWAAVHGQSEFDRDKARDALETINAFHR